MKKQFLAVIGFVLLLSACSSAPVEVKKESVLPPTPTHRAQETQAIFVGAVTDVVTLVAGEPEVSDVSTQVADIKEAAVQKLVAIGRLREEMTDQEKAEFDRVLSKEILGLYGDETFDNLYEIQKKYSGRDREFSNMLASFNILTQYTNFDLLKKQAPEEAKRLGIP